MRFAAPGRHDPDITGGGEGDLLPSGEIAGSERQGDDGPSTGSRNALDIMRTLASIATAAWDFAADEVGVMAILNAGFDRRYSRTIPDLRRMESGPLADSDGRKVDCLSQRFASSTLFSVAARWLRFAH